MPTPVPTPTPASAPMTYEDYLAKYMAQMGVVPATGTPRPTGAPQPQQGGGGGGVVPLAGAGLGAKIGMSLAGGSALPAGTAAGLVPGVAEAGAISGLLGSGGAVAAPTVAAVPGIGAGAAGAANAAALSSIAGGGAAPAGLLTGASPFMTAAVPLAFLGGMSALGPSIIKVGKKIGGFLGMGGNPDRPYNQSEVTASPLLNRQLPGFSKLDAAQKGALADRIQSSGLLTMPGSIPDAAAAPAGALDYAPKIAYNRLVRNPMEREKLEQQYGRYWHNTMSLEDVMKHVPQSTIKPEVRQAVSDIQKLATGEQILQALTGVPK